MVLKVKTRLASSQRLTFYRAAKGLERLHEMCMHNIHGTLTGEYSQGGLESLCFGGLSVLVSM